MAVLTMDFLDLSGEIIAFLWYFTPYVMSVSNLLWIITVL